MKCLGILSLALTILFALTTCASPNTPAADENAIATRVAANIFATQTASAPTERPAPPLTPEPSALAPERVAAQVTRVIDGDTIEVLINGSTYKVRYIGIDTPETVHPTKPVQWMGKEASDANKQLVDGKEVYLEKDISETDQYGRLLRYVYVADVFVNAELVRLGFAQVSTYPPDVKYQSLFLQMQQDAREAERGLWGATPTAVVVLPTATSAPRATQAAPTATTAPQTTFTVEIVSLTSPIPHGAYATLVIRTAPAAACTITVYYKSGPSKAQGLGAKTADASGQCSWTWRVGTNTTPGTWSIAVTASLNGQSKSLSIPFVVQ
jgi:micrococcal nuclease